MIDPPTNENNRGNLSLLALLAATFALATQSYVYRMVLKEDDRGVERQDVATWVLKKIEGQWKFIPTQSSSRTVPKKQRIFQGQ